VLRRLQRVNAMDTEWLLGFLLRCAAINYAILLLWFGALLLAHDPILRLHQRWFRLSPEAFDALNYGAIAAYKLANVLFFLVPALAIYWMRG
jgi:hypothetical protein